jgi:hypothetical protein
MLDFEVRNGACSVDDVQSENMKVWLQEGPVAGIPKEHA